MHTSIFQAEKYVIFACANLNPMTNYVKYIYINSDNQAVFPVLILVSQTTRIIENCVIILNSLVERNKVILRRLQATPMSQMRLRKLEPRKFSSAPNPSIGFSTTQLSSSPESNTYKVPKSWLRSNVVEPSETLINAYAHTNALGRNNLEMLNKHNVQSQT